MGIGTIIGAVIGLFAAKEHNRISDLRERRAQGDLKVKPTLGTVDPESVYWQDRQEMGMLVEEDDGIDWRTKVGIK